MVGVGGYQWPPEILDQGVGYICEGTKVQASSLLISLVKIFTYTVKLLQFDMSKTCCSFDEKNVIIFILKYKKNC